MFEKGTKTISPVKNSSLLLSAEFIRKRHHQLIITSNKKKSLDRSNASSASSLALSLLVLLRKKPRRAACAGDRGVTSQKIFMFLTDCGSFHLPPSFFCASRPHCPALLAAAAAPAAFDAAPAHAWSAGNRCLRHTFWPHPLHPLVLENVSVSLHRGTGHRGLRFLAGSHRRDRACASSTAASSRPVPGPPLDGVAAGLADDDGAALVRGARAAVVPVRPVLRAERLAAAVAVEGEEVELVAVLPVALRPQVRERLRAPPRHGKSIRRLVGCLDDSFLLLLESSETIALTSVVVVVAWIYRGRGSLPFPIPTRFAFLFRQEGWGAVWSGLE